MKVTPESFTFLDREEGRVKIPYFQRQYVWGKEQWDKLLDDLLEACRTGKGAYLGTIILQSVINKADGVAHSFVIDGQQRLTTLSLLLKALYDSLCEADKEKGRRFSKYYGCLFYMDEGWERAAPVRIEHSKVDRKSFQTIIDGIEPISADDPMASTSIGICYCHFAKKLKDESYISPEEIVKLFRYLLRDNNEIMVVIRLSESDDEQRIFHTMNTTGLRLSVADIFKNYFFQTLFESGDFSREEVDRLYQQNWERVFANDEGTEGFWNGIASSGDIKQDRREDILHMVAIIMGKFKSGKNAIGELSEIYKQVIDGMTKNQRIGLIKSIAFFAKIYRQKFHLFRTDDVRKAEAIKKITFGLEGYERRLFRIIHIYKVTAFHPYILHLYREYKDDENTLKTEFAKLETMLVRRCICKSPTMRHSQLCYDLIHRPEERAALIQDATPSNKAFMVGLKNIDRKFNSSSRNMARFILLMVEVYRRSNDELYKKTKELVRKYGKLELPDAYTLEHIMPVDWYKYWSTVPICPEGGTTGLTRQKLEYCRDSHINQIGNITLLEGRQNDFIANYDFRTKVEGGISVIGRNQTEAKGRFSGMGESTQLGITYFDIVEPYKKENKTTWDEGRIRQRTAAITKLVLEIWPKDEPEPCVTEEHVVSSDIKVMENITNEREGSTPCQS